MILDVPPRPGLAAFVSLLHAAGVPDAGRIGGLADQTVRHLKAGTGTVPHSLEARWYESLSRNQPDWSVYDDPEYLAEAWGCWMVYSRRYLQTVRGEGSMPPDGVVNWLKARRIKTVSDLGCGFGFTTAALTELFPTAKVVGTNLPDTTQYRVALKVADRYKFTMAPETGPADLVVAFEYFEHFEEPIDHLIEVLDAANPKALLIANTFNQPSTGHFPTYRLNGSHLDGSTIGQRFTDTLSKRGFEHIPTRCWNQRPALYFKASSQTDPVER